MQEKASQLPTIEEKQEQLPIEFKVEDQRRAPYVHISTHSSRAIESGTLTMRQVAVFALLNMMVDNAVRPGADGIEPSIAKLLGITERQIHLDYVALEKAGAIKINPSGRSALIL